MTYHALSEPCGIVPPQRLLSRTRMAPIRIASPDADNIRKFHWGNGLPDSAAWFWKFAFEYHGDFQDTRVVAQSYQCL
ncbi:hypothetical protein M405DRAFT_860579 [Rhizopogon salebrosus TDB-379]|nr:hypothetical protein M405DRAFT_860579 [Rhizopogon salebrosus TDB-379]